MEDRLTEKQTWEEYWDSKDDVSEVVLRNNPFDKLFEKIIKSKNIHTSIELGGFPGTYSVYLKKFFNVNSTLLDYIVHEKTTEKLSQANGLNKDSVTLIEADIFDYKPSNKYDLVFSMGLIEHFNNTEEVAKIHLQFLEDKGTLFITLPNFSGFNGMIQRVFDNENYKKHNIECMDVKVLKMICEGLPLSKLNVYYFGTFSLWLENEKERSITLRLFLKSIWFVGKVISKILPFESKLFSPYIVIEAEK